MAKRVFLCLCGYEFETCGLILFEGDRYENRDTG